MRKLLLGATLAASSIANAQDLGFKGVPFGATKEELMARFPALECKPTMRSFKMLGEEQCTTRLSSKMDDSLRQLYSYGGQPAQDASFGIVNGRFEQFSMKFTPGKYEAVRNSVSEAFGRGKESVNAMQTMGGMSFSSRTSSYAMVGGTITVLEHVGSIDWGGVDGRSPAFSAYVQRVKAGDPKTGSKDL